MSMLPLDALPERTAGAEGHYTACTNRNFFTRFGVPPWSRRLVAQLEVAKSMKLYVLAPRERHGEFLEERFDEAPGFTSV